MVFEKDPDQFYLLWTRRCTTDSNGLPARVDLVNRKISKAETKKVCLGNLITIEVCTRVDHLCQRCAFTLCPDAQAVFAQAIDDRLTAASK